MLELTAELIAEAGKTVTRPCYLVKIEFPAVGANPALTQYLSTLGSLNWNANLWVGADIRVANLNQDGSGSQAGALAIGNTDAAYGVITLTYGASDIPVTIWAGYADAIGNAYVVQVFKGVTNGANIDLQKVTFDLVADRSVTLYSPRVFVNKAAGFNFLQPEGTQFIANGETFIIKRTP